MPACETSCGGFKARPSEFATSKRTRGVLPPKRMAQEPVIKIHYHSFNVRIDFRLISKISIYIYIRNIIHIYILYIYIYIIHIYILYIYIYIIHIYIYILYIYIYYTYIYILYIYIYIYYTYIYIFVSKGKSFT